MSKPSSMPTPEVAPEEPRKSPPKSAGPKRRRLTLEERIAASEAETERLRKLRAGAAEDAYQDALTAIHKAHALAVKAGKGDDAERCKVALAAMNDPL